MNNKDLAKALKDIAGHEDVINSISLTRVPVKAACNISLRSLSAWSDILQEMNDVVTALDDEPLDSYDFGYRQATAKWREVIMKRLGMVKNV